MAAGANGLLRDGARVVLGAEDVIDELFGVRPAGPQGARQTAQEQELTPLERGVLDGVEAGEGVDGIVRRTGATAAEARAALARLEDQGAIVRGRLGSYERVACR